MKKLLKGLMVLVVLVPMMVSAKEITEASEPYYLDGAANTFVANGTPIVIEEIDGVTYAIWDGGKQALNVGTVVVGGYYNPEVDESGNVIDLDSTSITMNSGKVFAIHGGNAIDAKVESYDRIHVNTINMSIKNADVTEISGVSMTYKGVSDTVVPAEMFDNAKEFYTADKVNFTFDNSTTKRIYFTSSYTYAKDVLVNVLNNSVVGETGILDGSVVVAYNSLSAGTNGFIDNYVVNVEDSKVTQVDGGLRVMIQNMEVNIAGDSEIDYIFAGSAYREVSKSNQATTWNKLGNIAYGQVGNMIINIAKGVKYNNIYAGFQFASLNGNSEYDKFYETFDDLVAAGLSNAKTALVTINIAQSPMESENTLESMISDINLDNVVVNYITEVKAPIVDATEGVAEVAIGVVNTNDLNIFLDDNILNNNAEVKNAINAGDTITTNLEITKIEANEELIDKVNTLLEEITGNKIVVGYYNIEILINNTTLNTTLGNITELTNPLTLTVLLPDELQQVSEGYTRTYYMLREHDGKIEVLDTTVASDGKSLTFETDKFSNYALVYSDVLIDDDEPVIDEPVENPSTNDSVGVFMALGAISVMGLATATVVLKKRHN